MLCVNRANRYCLYCPERLFTVLFVNTFEQTDTISTVQEGCLCCYVLTCLSKQILFILFRKVVYDAMC